MILRGLKDAIQALSAADPFNGNCARLGASPARDDPGAPRGCVFPSAIASHTQQIVQQMLAYIHRHYCRPLRLGDLAAVLKMNGSYLSAMFSRTMGITMHRYIEERRLCRATQLLRDPLYRVNEVAYAAGYSSPKQFGEVFKARFGVSPSAWRALPALSGRRMGTEPAEIREGPQGMPKENRNLPK